MTKARKSNAVCPYLGKCGGCSAYAMPYEEQLARKREKVSQALADAGVKCADGFNVSEVVPSKEQWEYRNKIELAPFLQR
ncbi:MAG: hypothetical protein LBM21_03405, partial [Coriobacteriales bacterium]|nr:hypothetical protein [Coriobacteriales bacterium]